MRCRRSPSRPCRADATYPGTGRASPVLGPVGPVESSGPSSVSPSWWRSLFQGLSHRDRIVLVPRGSIESLTFRVRLAREDDDVGRAALPGDALEVPHEPGSDA